MTAATGTRGGGGQMTWVGIGAAVVAVVTILVLAGRGPTGDPFDQRSPAPDGYRALSVLLGQRGAEVGRRSAAAVSADPPGPGEVLVVPAPGLATGPELRSFRAAADGGAIVVFGEPPPGEGSSRAGLAGPLTIDARTLADTPADPVPPGGCDMAALTGLGDIDAAFASPAPAAGHPSCYGDDRAALVQSESIGRGTVITLGSPYLLANARLQPDKEHGGQPLDNAAVALRLFGPGPTGAAPGVRVTFVDARPSTGVRPDGTESPLSLLPFRVQLALAQLVGAFILYAWWRGRRLGAPVRERIPVEIAGSELVSAVGDLLRRRGSPDRAAATMRADVRRALAGRLGLPPDADAATLAAVVAARTGRDPEEVTAAFEDRPVGSAQALVRLANLLDSISQEALHGHPVP